ncbi:MAG: metalloregulator ArsR/SmtB family transcription factor [Candidatus Peregrinibacteria bacterium]|nr:metalloregulator ArsR/SmtB family transcription factor [Candidatus Peregrinibacteria bacterium]
MRGKQYKIFLELLKSLGDSTRLDVVIFISSGEKCVCEIFKHLKLSQNLVSHHLGILRKNKLIIARKDGKRVYYSLNKEKIDEFQKYLDSVTETKEIKSKC